MPPFPPKYDVFISYRHRDEAVARDVYEQLSRNGYSVFLDREKIAPGESIRVAVERALYSSRAFVPIFNENTDANSNLFFELGLFLGLQRGHHKIIPIVTNQFNTNQMPSDLASIQFVKWDLTNIADGLQHLMQAIGPPEASQTLKVIHGPDDREHLSIELTIDGAFSIEDQEKLLNRIQDLLKLDSIRVQSRRQG